MLSKRPVHVDVGKGKVDGPVVVTGTLVTLLSVVLDAVVVVLGGVAVVLVL